MEKEKLSPLQCIKRFFERADAFAPDGGKKLEMAELKAMKADKAGYEELAVLAAKELGVEVVPT